MNWTDRSYEWPCYSDRIMTSVMRNAIIAGETAVKATTEILFIVSWGGRRGRVAFSRPRIVQVVILVIVKYIGGRFCRIHIVPVSLPSRAWGGGKNRIE